MRAAATVRVPAARGARARTYRLGPATRNDIAAGARVTLTMAISQKARTAIRRALRAHKMVSATATLVVKDVAGNAKTLTRRIKLRR